VCRRRETTFTDGSPDIFLRLLGDHHAFGLDGFGTFPSSMFALDV
jgi:hypothetical protein